MKVIILTSNEPELARLLAALGPQLEENNATIEIIDDFSSPVHLEYVKTFQVLFDGISIHRKKMERDFSKQRNFGLSLVPEGELAVFVDSDEMVGPDFLSCIREQATDPRKVYLIPRVNILWKEPVKEDVSKFSLDLGLQDAQARVLYGGSGMTYKGKVHERLIDEEGNSYPYEVIKNEKAMLWHIKCLYRLHSVVYNMWREMDESGD